MVEAEGSSIMGQSGVMVEVAGPLGLFFIHVNPATSSVDALLSKVDAMKAANTLHDCNHVCAECSPCHAAAVGVGDGRKSIQVQRRVDGRSTSRGLCLT